MSEDVPEWEVGMLAEFAAMTEYRHNHDHPDCREEWKP